MIGQVSKGRVGLYFGSFNPIHMGHLVIANHMVHRADLDQVWMVVTPSSPFKLNDQVIPEHHRLRMVKLAVVENTLIFASDVEFELDRPNFTADTLKHLRGKYPEIEFSVILGEDNYESFHKWKDYENILSHHRLLVYPRRKSKMIVQDEPLKENALLQKVNPDAVVLFTEAPMIAISSTYIREAILDKQDVQYLLSDPVISYIGNNHLYEPV
ncbi:MAG: nicotinic acid mononucleotide adenylyltransferase [Bacteroidetes bacterium]|nr:MAG: nicotinic acid mononucleotide adenylyltransferase [Bacteroidota bacterium]